MGWRCTQGEDLLPTACELVKMGAGHSLLRNGVSAAPNLACWSHLLLSFGAIAANKKCFHFALAATQVVCALAASLITVAVDNSS